MSSQSEQLPTSSDSSAMPFSPVAVIGYACRLPGGVTDGDSYWNLLSEGRDAVTEIPEDRWNPKAFAGRAGLKGKSASKWGGFLDQVDQFEPGCFGISPREAQYLDPQQRLLLETTYEALENAGIPTDSLSGSRTGVFVGISTGDYGQLQQSRNTQFGLSAFTAQGCSLSIAANRISYCLDLRGPSFIVDTACSSSLVAFDRACKSLQDGESDLTIVGGANFILNPETFISFSQASMLSPDGRCKAFDASANGFVRSEGGGAFILKRLDAAIRDGDAIKAVVVGSGVNQDGRTGGISMPNPESQEALLREVYANAGIAPQDVRYIEAHGTGTAVGDPSEAEALGRVFGPTRRKDEPLLIGSCKTNLGHLEAASGIASLAKVLQVFEHRQIPPSLHYKKPNPNISFEEHQLQVCTELRDWPDAEAAIIGVNSFGFGGANAHVVLAEPAFASQLLNRSNSSTPSISANGRSQSASVLTIEAEEQSREEPLVLSARTPETLAGMAAAWVKFLKSDAADSTAPNFNDALFTAALRRTHYSHRLGLVGQDSAELLEQLNAFVLGESRPQMHVGESKTTAPQVAFVFCGQGPQWFAMGRDLMGKEAVFREALEEIDALLSPITGWSLIAALSQSKEESQIQLTSYAQPALFAIHVGLARLWKSWGVEPDAVVGHSVGEIAAAHIAGILSLEDAVRVIGHRGICLEEHAQPGRMLAAGLTEQEALTVLKEFEPDACLAAVNSPKMVTLAGTEEALERLGERLTKNDVWWKALQVRHAFHSSLVEDAEAPFLKEIENITASKPGVKMVSTVTGLPVGDEGLAVNYWWDNIRQPVRFADAIQNLSEDGIEVFLELGPHPVLGGSIKQSLPADGAPTIVLPSLVRQEPERRAVLAAAVGLFAQGVSVDWKALWPNPQAVVDLPTHPWTYERFWNESLVSRNSRLAVNYHPLLGHEIPAAQNIWQNRLDLNRETWVQDHRAGGRIIFPAAGFVEMFLAAGTRALKSSTMTIDDVSIQSGLFLSADATPLTQVAANALSSRLTIASKMNETDEAWSEHAHATFRDLPLSRAAVPLDLENWKADADDASAEDFYRTFHEMDLGYGPAFQGVKQLWRKGKSALGRIELDQQAVPDTEDYLAHPGLLDSCFQVLLEATPPDDRPTDRMFLPERIRRIYLHRPVGTNAWSEVRLSFYSKLRAVGDIRVYTADGELAVELLGLECRAVISTKDREGEDVQSFLYQTQWHHEPLEGFKPKSEPIPCDVAVSEMAERATDAARTTWHDVGLEIVPLALRQQDQLANGYLVQALRKMGLTLLGGDTIDLHSLVESGQLVPQHRLLLEKCFERFATEGLMQRAGETWNVLKDFPEPDTDDIWRESLAKFPELYPHLRVIEVCGRDLEGIFTGQVDPLKVLFTEETNDLLEQIYSDQLWPRSGNTFLQRLCTDLIDRLPAHRPIRILEVGAGLGGTTTTLLPVLPANRCEYWFTDVSPFFLSRAEEKFRRNDYDFVHYQRFDLEQPLEDQGVPAHSFDIVIAADVLHATADITTTLNRCSELLVDGGLLAIRELTHTAAAFDLVFGLMEGWWKYVDDPARSHSALLTGKEWSSILTDVGFEEPSQPKTGEAEQYATVVVARQPARADSEMVQIGVPELELAEKTWLILTDQSGEGERLAKRVRENDRRAILVSAGDSFEKVSADEYQIQADQNEDFERLIREIGPVSSDMAIVHLWSLDCVAQTDSPLSLEADEARICHSVVALAQAVTSEPPHAPRRFLLVTQGGRDLATAADAGRSLQGAMVGLGRVFLNEYRQMRVQMVDLDPQSDQSDALWAEIVADDSQQEVAWRGAHRLVPRLGSVPAFASAKNQEAVPPFELNIARKGDLSSLGLKEIEEVAPVEGEVQVDIHFVALNFRDILRALGQFPAEDPIQLSPGDEATGIVRSVGPGVEHLQPGDRVVICHVGCFRSLLTVPTDRVMKIPEHLSLSEAVSMPVAYITVIHALETIGRLKQDESILIHSAAGGVGTAAVHVARSIGAKIYATAGSVGKRELLSKFGPAGVMNSRTLDFFDDLSEATDGNGVNVVLNSLAGQAMARSLASMAPYGRFLELGKRDFYENTAIGLYPFRHNVSYHAVDLSQILKEEPSEGLSLLHNTFAGDHAFPPLPMRVLPAARLQDAFRLMGQGVHIGKIVVDMTQHWGQVQRLDRLATVRGDGTYVISGAFGGAGLEVARWLADRGAKHLVMLSRSGPRTEAAQEMVQALEARGVEVRALMCDVSKQQSVEETFAEIRKTMPPMVGIFHLAMVLDDAIIGNLDQERFLSVTRPKSHGAWHLHEQTLDLDLDMFVMFSSASTVIGNLGQANYAAANAALESLAEHRRKQGLAASAIGWGVLGEVGYVAQRQELEESLAKVGLQPMSIADIRGTLDAVLSRGSVAGEQPVTVAVRADWQKLGQRFHATSPPPGLLTNLIATAGEDQEASEGIAEAITAASSAERSGLMMNFVKGRVGRVLGMSPQKLADTQPLSEMGLDSLMAVELASIVESDLGVSLPVSALSRDINIKKLSNTLLTTLTGSDADDKTESPVVETSVAPEENCLVTLRAGAGDPLYVFHPAGGELRVYDDLVPQLGTDYPVYGLQRIDAEPFDSAGTMSALAAEYAEVISRAQPDGPLRFFGFSFGGLMAVHVASHLEARGREVLFVGVVECDPMNMEADSGREDRLTRFIRETFELMYRESGFTDELDRDSLDRQARLVAKSLDSQSITEWKFEDDHLLSKIPRSIVEDYLNRMGRDLTLMTDGAAILNEPIKCPLSIWSADEGLGSGIETWTTWTRSECNHLILQGEHFSVMFQPRVGKLAEHLAATMEQCGSGQRISS